MKAIIGIDAGHGGSSSGTYTVNSVLDGLFEKDFALELALMVEQKLKDNGFLVIMSRREDKNPGTVLERAKKFILANVDFALSIHFNGFEKESANGTEVFVPYKENLAGIESGFYQELEKHFALRKPFAKSSDYYNRNSVFDKKLNLEKRRFDAAENKKDYFGFVRSCWEAGISADLLEVCFLTNKEDFDAYQQNKEKIADGIAKSIVEGFGEKYLSVKAKDISVPPRIRRKIDFIN